MPDEDDEIKYDPAEWCGLKKSEMASLDRVVRYSLPPDAAYNHYKSVRKHMPRLIALGLADSKNVATEKGKDLIRKWWR